jgi:hypothetical protein
MSEFRKALEYHAANADISPGVTEHCPCCPSLDDWDGDTERYYDEASEPYFSRSPCDSCGSHLGGHRYAAHSFDGEPTWENLIHWDICVDCLFFFANGEEPTEWE